MNRANYNADFITGGLLDEIGEHPDAQIKGGGLLNPYAERAIRIANMDVNRAKTAAQTARQALVTNAANIAAGYSRPDDQERDERTNEERIRSSEEADPRNEMQW